MITENKKVKVLSVFPIRDKNLIYANLQSTNWDFKLFGQVYVCSNNKKIKMYYKGYGNNNDKLVIMLSLENNSQYESIEQIISALSDDIWIERID